MSYRSTALIAVLVFALLFSLLYSSSLVATKNAEEFYQVLSEKRADLEIYRLRIPQNICFELDSEILRAVDQGMAGQQPYYDDSLSKAMERADIDAQMDHEMEAQMQMPQEYFEQMGNRYTGEGLRLERAEAIVPFLRAYDGKLDHLITRMETRGIVDTVHQYSCNFGYEDKYYGLDTRLYSLSSLNEYSGYLPISITNQMLNDRSLDPKTFTVFRFFNNTAVWENRSDSWLTLEIVPDTTDIPPDLFDITLRPISTKIPPSNSWDLYLGGRIWAGDTTFHYRIQEYPWIQGTIHVKRSPQCMDFDTARSLYSQTKFPFKTPSYVPEGYEYRCMQANMASVYLYYSSSQTFLPEFMSYGVAEGQILVYMDDYDRYFGIYDSPEASVSDNERIRKTYGPRAERNSALDSHLIDINGKLAWGHEAASGGSMQTITFPDGSQLTIPSSLPARLIFYDNGTGIRLEGYVLLQELVRMAESLK